MFAASIQQFSTCWLWNFDCFVCFSLEISSISAILIFTSISFPPSLPSLPSSCSLPFVWDRERECWVLFYSEFVGYGMRWNSVCGMFPLYRGFQPWQFCVDILGRKWLVGEGGVCLMFWWMLTSILSLFSVDASSIPWVVMAKNTSRHCQSVPYGAKLSWLRTIALI